jgi:adenylate cyclase
VELGGKEIPLDVSGGFLVYWYGHQPGTGYAFRHYPVHLITDSAKALGEGRPPDVPLAEFKDKMVVIGPSAIGIGDFHASPMASTVPGVEYQATLVSNLLQGDFVRPAPAIWNALAILVLSLGTSLAVWRFADWRAYSGAALALAAVFTGGNLLLFQSERTALVLAAPLGALATAFAAGNLTRYITEGREKRRYRATLMKYVSPPLVEAMMKDPGLGELHNEKRELTVLFSDVRGFTTISEKIPVDELVRTLNEFLSAMVEVIFKNGGTLDKFVGDCVMAFWGAPVRQDDHAARAARTALEMIATLEALNEGWRKEGRQELHIGVGINTGEMILGNIGSERRMDFTVIGDNVNLAARLESSTKELKASIVISEATYRQIEHLVQVRDLGTIHVKGKDVPIKVYELLGTAGKENVKYESAQTGK